MALAIEKQWELNPKLSFEEALNIEFKKFGIYGFSDIVERRKSEMNKRYHKFVWQHFKDFFTIPKILLTISLTVLLSILLISLKPYYGSLSFSLSISILAIVFFFAFRNKMVLSKKRKKRWMMEEVIANYGGAALLWYIPLHFFFNNR